MTGFWARGPVGVEEGGIDEVPGAEVDGTETGADEGGAVVVEVAGACEACAGVCAAVGAAPVTGTLGACVGTVVGLDEAVELGGAADAVAGAWGGWAWLLLLLLMFMLLPLLLCRIEAYDNGVDEPWCEDAPCEDAGGKVDDTGCAETSCKNNYKLRRIMWKNT